MNSKFNFSNEDKTVELSDKFLMDINGGGALSDFLVDSYLVVRYDMTYEQAKAYRIANNL